MKTIITSLNLSTSLFVGMTVVLVIALMMIVSVPHAYAMESPDILIGGDLTVGSTGQGVVVLQGLLSEMGFLNVPIGVPFGYFGSRTKNALAQYQASQIISPAVGYFGPVTKVTMHQQFASHGWLNLLGW